eukprot:scaffold10157_cov142-Skeletonema_dohrnii-CCMP3373.AAC.19
MEELGGGGRVACSKWSQSSHVRVRVRCTIPTMICYEDTELANLILLLGRNKGSNTAIIS